ncbi:AraC family transcriptional regulator [Streptomyces hoynatensis]|uniref:AraC family transcriptional regulator n=1 Tax=Streptomyces hoynatensis TaxID=1141874 RepID=A0A3A9YRA8_9ACTN|nr:AraC family transcriptional regulator [Streptomyces hoynatensis]RKN38523.1 AraC family transcriptional regulator [Streptomyces hoynatensis]
MDVLSDVVRVMRTGQPRSARVERRGPWHEPLQPAPGTALFEVLLAGSCLLIPPEGSPIPLGAGDVLFVPRAGGYRLAGAPWPPNGKRSGDVAPQTGPADGAAGAEGGAPRALLLRGACHLDADRGHPLFGDVPDVLHLPARLGHHPRLRATVDLLATELEDPGPGGNAVVSSLLEALLLYVLRAWLQEKAVCTGPTGWGAALADPAVRGALDAMHADPAHPWTVAALAARGGVSRASFARRFSATVGRPPLAYLTWWRLTTAARLLRDSDAPLSAVAARVGYRSEYSFAHAFKREFALAPGRYRRGAPPP